MWLIDVADSTTDVHDQFLVSNSPTTMDFKLNSQGLTLVPPSNVLWALQFHFSKVSQLDPKEECAVTNDQIRCDVNLESRSLTER